ncbi:venom carboxylesterase-6-like [Ischnura elegans]|uniref:venom carboxylesterase-6-like n=1 Tax=Ischnura elegans TaxID=197161 RepID=UPI001ED8811A|nr:venom carboxylesterase-6-like [Ischnura elegans]
MNMWKSFATTAVLFAALLQHLCVAIDERRSSPVAYCSFGALRGITMKSRSGRDFDAYLGIKYGLARRFEHPEPVREEWDGVRNAVADGDSCPQSSISISGKISEDCLFLNVYTPKRPTKGENHGRLPVIIYIHPGAYATWSGQSSEWGAHYWMDKDVVLVTINYRLGSFGFLSTGDSVVPGNNGLKDQVLAMQWVQANIECFGGDKNLVTLLGYSAGGASVNFHMASKLSQHLFHRGISMGGTASCGWAMQKNQREMLRKQAKLLNCPYDEKATSKQIVDCLRRISTEELAQSYNSLRDWAFNPIIPLTVVVEPKGSYKSHFLTEEPECIFQSGNFAHKPWITGTASNEMMNFAEVIVSNGDLVQEFGDYFNIIAPLAFSYDKGSILSAKKSKILKDFYFPNGCITNNSLQYVSDIYTDGTFLYCADHSVKLISSKNKFPTYYYHFDFLGKYSGMTTYPGYCKKDGPVHHDELTLLFYRKDVSPFLNDSSVDTVISKKLVELFTNFAITGNPTPSHQSDGDSLIDFHWYPHTHKDLYYLDMREKFVMKKGYRQKRAALWDQIFCKDENHPTCDGPAMKYQCQRKEK